MRGVYCSGIDADHTCYWSAPASVYCKKGSISATFTPAPVNFGFSVYNIFLISGSSFIRRLTVNTTDDVSLTSSSHLLPFIFTIISVSNCCNINTSSSISNNKKKKNKKNDKDDGEEDGNDDYNDDECVIV